MKDIVIVDHNSGVNQAYVDRFGLIIGTELDEDTQKSYQTMAKRLKELAKRNMRVLKRKEKIKRICQN